MKIRQWIFPVLLALLFAAVLLAGLVPWDRILPEKEELPADAVEIGTLDTVQPLKGDYTIQYDDPDDPEGGVTVPLPVIARTVTVSPISLITETVAQLPDFAPFTS